MPNQVDVLDRAETAYGDQPTGIEERYDARLIAETGLIFRDKGIAKLLWRIREREMHQLP